MLEELAALRTRLHGDAITAEDFAYDDLRSVFNRQGQPAVIVRCADTQDVCHAVDFARRHGLEISVRSGGHGLSGNATNDGGLVIDFSLMRKVDLHDPKQGLVRIEPGATWGEVAAALQPFGWAITSGDTGSVGVGGLTVGGGIGWMVRKYGLTIDHLKSVEVVTASGEIVTASVHEHQDLFWAVRGGGGNFGVITAFEFEAKKQEHVVYGSLYFDGSEARSVIGGWARYCEVAVDDLTSILMLFPPSGDRGAAILVLVCYAGSVEDAQKAIEPIAELGTLTHHQLGYMPYASAVPNHGPAHFAGAQVAHRTQFMQGLSDASLDVITHDFGKLGSPMLQLRVLGGAMARVSDDATAFAHRSAKLLAISMLSPDVGESRESAEKTLDRYWKGMAPFGSGAYVNFLEDSEDAATMAYPSETLERLLRVKDSYDPQNLFRGGIPLKR